jgi:hypothetical protein
VKRRLVYFAILLIFLFPAMGSCRSAAVSTPGGDEATTSVVPPTAATSHGPSENKGTSSTPSSIVTQETNSAGANITSPAPVKLLPVITVASLPEGGIGVPYSQYIAAAGGDSPYTWSLFGGSLPEGLSLNTLTGEIFGTSAVAGTSSFTIQVTDSSGATAIEALAITIDPRIRVAPMPDGDVGVLYSHFLMVSGVNAPYIWSITGGALPSGLALDAPTGTISGIPALAGISTFTAQVTGATAQTVSVTMSITINPAPTMITTSLPAGKIGTFYLESLATSGGTYPFNWSLTDGLLPAGVLLDTSTGTIIGTPTATGVFSFTTQLRDSTGVIIAQPLSITINAAPDIINTSLPLGFTGALYSANLLANAGNIPYTWSLTTGSLPPGLSLDASTGTITGIPAVAGTYSFTVRLTDDTGATETQPLSITINQFINTVSLPVGEVGVLYSQTLATNEDIPYVWSLVSGALPKGLILDASGVIMGTPTAAGTFALVARVTGITETGQALFVAISITINQPPTIITTSLSAGKVGVPYSQTIAVSGGTAPYVWSLDGFLPFGLSLDRSTGVISGTPTIDTEVNFVIIVSDTAGATATGVFTLKVYSGDLLPKE